MTPTIDTNEPGHSGTPVDPRSATFQATDGVGHLGWALQAEAADQMQAKHSHRS